MAQKPETIFRKKAMDKFKALPNSYWTSIQQKGIFGSPDVVGCVNMIFVSLEFKKDAQSKPTPLQEYKKGKIREAHGFSFIIYPENFKEIHSILNVISIDPMVYDIYLQLTYLIDNF
jgi:hypothetical protein